MYSIQPQHKNSFLANKQNQFRKEIRRQQLDAYFASKRKLKLQQDISESQKRKYLNNFAQLLQQFFTQPTNQQAESHLKILFDQLTRDNVNIPAAILLQPSKLIKLFTLFPENRYSIQILRMMIEYCYDQTFGLDDQKFVFLHNQNSFQVKIQPNQMTEYQQALDALMKAIHCMIPELQHRRPIKYLTSIKEMEEANEKNKGIERKIKIYLACLGDISTRVNSFIMRYEYVEKYISTWSKWLLVDYDFCKGQILRYINLACRFIIPFQSLSKFSVQTLAHQQYETDEIIILRIFELCVPQGQKDRIDTDKNDILAISIIEPLFSYVELKIDVVVKFFDQISRLLRLVLLKRQHFKLPIVTKMFRLITNIINRFIYEANNQNATEKDQKIIRSINLIQIVQNMQFLQTFSIYLCYQHWAHQNIFKIICGLIEYCIEFDIQIESVIGYKNFFIEICHKISHDDREIMKTNLKSLGMICRYAEVCGKNALFAAMVQNGVRETLENLAYSLFDEFVGHEARQLLQLYFTEQQVQEYTKEEYEREMDVLKIPDRNEIYDD